VALGASLTEEALQLIVRLIGDYQGNKPQQIIPKTFYNHVPFCIRFLSSSLLRGEVHKVRNFRTHVVPSHVEN
jgi:hypothetical protein